MKWNALKSNKCPKCLGLLNQNPITAMHECLNCNDFMISEEKFNSIVNNIYHPKKIANEDDRLSEINNLK